MLLQQEIYFIVEKEMESYRQQSWESEEVLHFLLLL